MSLIVRRRTPSLALAVGVSAPAAVWHQRLGHAGHERLAQLVQHGMVNRLHVPAAVLRRLASHCETFTLSKLRRAPF